MLKLHRSLLACGLALGVAACSEDSQPDGPEIEPAEEYPLLGCDPLVPSHCGFPFPSNVHTVRDESTPTGLRVELLPEMMPQDSYGGNPAPDPWNRIDGFSTGMALLAHFPEVTPASMEALPSAVTIERSLEDDCPTVLLEVATGRRVAHWAELDMTTEDDAQRTFMIRPAQRLLDASRYIVAIRGLTDANGGVIEPSEAFVALRDGIESEDSTVQQRRPLYADIFNHLREADVAVEDLQLAWDFTTASKENNTGWMVHMRDEALGLVGDAGPEYEIISVETDWNPEHIAYRIFGEMTVPMYLDQPDPGANLIFGDDGLPEPNPAQPWGRFSFEVLIPHSAVQSPAAILQYGHGLLGGKEQIESEHFRTFINEYNYVLMGVDFIGMAADDETHIGALIDAGRFDQFQSSVDRQHQGMLNSLLAMRMMKTSFAADPDYGATVDPNQSYYLGISQGGIFGGTYMAVSTDVTRGTLGVPGMPYNLLLSRSVDFDQFFVIIRSAYRDARDQTLLLGLNAMLWDRMEPNGYAAYIREDLLPNTPSHDVLLRAAVGDHQVTTYGAHFMARSIGVPHVDTGIRDIWGLDKVPAPVEGSALVEYAFGLPPEPVENVPLRECEDPHGKLRKLEEARMQLDTFFRQGRVENFCASGVCSFPDMSGCP